MKNFFYLAAFLMIAVSGCSSYKLIIDVPKPKPYLLPYPSQTIAGIAQRDLTLPPGYPMSGYSINGRISRGYWIRPKATALYLRDKDGTPFVFVATDLWGITDGQRMAVLQSLSCDPKTNFIGESELLLAATHAHNGPGVIELDKAFASTSIGFGIDTAAFEFTIRQIVDAIKEAVDSVEAATVTYSTIRVDSVAKNRSLEAYFANHPAERQAYLPHNPIEKNRFYRSKEETESTIEHQLSVITVKNFKGEVKGILASYPMHPTATGDETEVYSADVFGLASIKALDKIPTPIIAFYNGAEGDVAPNYRFHHRSDAVRIADTLAEAICLASQSNDQVSLTGTITHRTKIIDITSKQTTIDPFDICCNIDTGTMVSTARVPVVGAAVLAGASDGRTSLSSFGISEGIHSDEWDTKQGHKEPAVKFLAEKVLGPVLPKSLGYILKKLVKITPSPWLHISIHKAGDVYFVGLPGEFTTMLGRRVRKTVSETLGIPASAISLVGLADSYISYVTTPLEYDKQFYEGASDFFGMFTGAVFVEEYKSLAKNGADTTEKREKRKTVYNAGKIVKFGPEHLGDLQVWNAEEGLNNLLVSADEYKVHSHKIPPMELYYTSRGPIMLDANEIIAYSFKDKVNTIKINEKNFYPHITVQTANHKPIPLPEHILTVDIYNGAESIWTVRILNTSSLPTDTPIQILVTPLSGVAQPPSGFFMRTGVGVK